MASWRDLFSVLGFGEGEDREIEKREEQQSMGMCFGGRRRLVLHLSGFGKDFFFFAFMYFFFLVSEKFFFLCLCFFFILNIVLMWKIVGASKTSVLYIYIYIIGETKRTQIRIPN